MSNNYYEILELDKNCSKDDIKKQYKKFALLYHPDKNKDEDSSEKFQKINFRLLVLKKRIEILYVEVQTQLKE